MFNCMLLGEESHLVWHVKKLLVLWCSNRWKPSPLISRLISIPCSMTSSGSGRPPPLPVHSQGPTFLDSDAVISSWSLKHHKGTRVTVTIVLLNAVVSLRSFEHHKITPVTVTIRPSPSDQYWLMQPCMRPLSVCLRKSSRSAAGPRPSFVSMSGSRL